MNFDSTGHRQDWHSKNQFELWYLVTKPQEWHEQVDSQILKKLFSFKHGAGTNT